MGHLLSKTEKKDAPPSYETDTHSLIDANSYKAIREAKIAEKLKADSLWYETLQKRYRRYIKKQMLEGGNFISVNYCEYDKNALQSLVPELESLGYTVKVIERGLS